MIEKIKTYSTIVKRVIFASLVDSQKYESPFLCDMFLEPD
jgi:hypothetical protein